MRAHPSHLTQDGFNSRAEPFPLAVEVRGVGAEKQKMKKLIEREKEAAWEDLRELDSARGLALGAGREDC
jgi:hypothetical protein